MGFNFRKSIKLGGGIKLNVSNKGVGASAGVKGARIGVSSKGVRGTASLPGTGISYTKTIKGNNSTPESADFLEPSSIDYAKRRKINKVLLPILLIVIAFFILVIILVNL